MSTVAMSNQNRSKIGGGSGQDLLDGEFLGLNHSPPQFTPSSYEASHMHKRIRSGSISGRLRSASELEDKGIIDRMQKGALKNLIMSGDEHLLSALDKFSVEGDSAELHALLKSGALEGQPGLDLDLLMDDLDMNFLHLTSGLGGGAGGAAGTGGVGTAGGGGREGRQGGGEVENYQFDMDDMASFIAGDHGVGQGVGAGSFVDDLNLLVGGGVGGGMVGRSMSPGQGGSLSGLGLSPFGLEGGAGGMGAGTYFVAVKEEVPLQQGGRRGVGGGGMGGKGKVVKGAGPALLSIKHKPPSGSPSSSSSPASIPPSSSASGPAGTRGLAIPRQSPPPQTKGQKKTTAAAAAAAAAAASVANVAATVGAALANKPHGAGAAKGNSSSSSNGGKASSTPSGAAGIISTSHASPSPSSSSTTTTTSCGGGNGAASLLMPVPRASPPPSLPHSSEGDVNKHYIGAYSPESRRMRLEKFWDKKKNRIWDRKVKYDVRKNFADSRVRVKGRFVKKEDEAILIEVNTLTSREGAMDAAPVSAGGGGGGGGGGMSASSLMPGVERGGEGAMFQDNMMMPSSSSGGGGGSEMVMLKEEGEDGNEIAAGVEDLEDLLAPLEEL